MTQKTPIAVSHNWALVCHLLKFTPANFSGFIASVYPLVITKWLSGFWIIGKKSDLAMHKLIPTIRKRPTT
jgi:fucose 4-O-acetylase-like acetyltransferase